MSLGNDIYEVVTLKQIVDIFLRYHDSAARFFRETELLRSQTNHLSVIESKIQKSEKILGEAKTTVEAAMMITPIGEKYERKEQAIEYLLEWYLDYTDFRKPTFEPGTLIVANKDGFGYELLDRWEDVDLRPFLLGGTSTHNESLGHLTNFWFTNRGLVAGEKNLVHKRRDLSRSNATDREEIIFNLQKVVLVTMGITHPYAKPNEEEKVTQKTLAVPFNPFYSTAQFQKLERMVGKK